jgi:hypothetical protein
LTSNRINRISFWDALVLQSALALGCKVVWSEDLNSGQLYDEVKVINPFVDLGCINGEKKFMIGKLEHRMILGPGTSLAETAGKIKTTGGRYPKCTNPLPQSAGGTAG